MIQPGTYAGGITHATPGAAGRPITYRAAVAGQAIIDGSGGERDAFFITESPWVVVEGLRIQNADRAAVRVSLSNHVTIRNIVAANNGTWGIFTDYSDDLLLEDNECFGSQDEHGIYVSNSGDRPVIRNNRVHDNAAGGIQINADPAMLWPELGTTGDGITAGALVENNIVWGNGRLGGAAVNLASVRNSLFRNNLLYDNLAGGIAGWDDGNGDAWGTRDNTFVHNTVVFESGAGRTALNLQNGSTGNTVRNNILAGGRSVAIRFDASSLAGLTSDYNLLHSLDVLSGVAVNDDTGTISGLAAWRTLTGGDVHSTWADPAFADRVHDNYDLSAASPARNAGDPGLVVTPDLDGLRRPQETAPDMGALEYAALGPIIDFPNTADGIHVFSDQFPDDLSDAMLQFIASHFDGAQKMRTVFTDAVRAYNENFVMLHYRLAVGHGQHALLIDDDWASDWDDVNPHEDWFLHAASDPAQRLRQVDWDWNLMDIENADWREYWLQSTIDQIRSVKAQGVFADSWDVAAYNADVLDPWDARFRGHGSARQRLDRRAGRLGASDGCGSVRRARGLSVPSQSRCAGDRLGRYRLFHPGWRHGGGFRPVGSGPAGRGRRLATADESGAGSGRPGQSADPAGDLAGRAEHARGPSASPVHRRFVSPGQRRLHLPQRAAARRGPGRVLLPRIRSRLGRSGGRLAGGRR